MPTARQDLGAARGPDGQVYAIGGYNSGGYLATTEAYNPDSNSWSIVASLPATVCCMGVAAVSTGQIYVIGGAGDPGTEVYTLNFAASVPPAPPTWSTLNSLPAPRVRPATATGNDGNIYVFGGSADNNDYNTMFIYHPQSYTWTQGANMPTAREGGQAVTLPDGRIIVLGGGTGCHGTQHCAIYGTAELYTPHTNTWRAAAFMQTPRYRFATALGKDGRVYAIGGWDGSRALYSVEAYNPRNNSWTYVPSLPLAEEAPAAALDRHGRLIVVGGWDGRDTGATYYSNTFIYSNGGWSNATTMPTARGDLGAARGPDGQIYAVGGYNGNGYLATTEAYNPDSNSWSIVASLPLKVCCVGVVAVPTGQIYAIGGAGDSSGQVAMLDLSSTLRSSARRPSR